MIMIEFLDTSLGNTFEETELIADYRWLADKIVDGTPRNSEQTTAIRKLIESMDCSLRAMRVKTCE